ncbi:MAG: glycosyltransferase, partial [Bacteroidales bacterium]|nr:glycosyltransferase [Bacteroidales bacterium]
LNEGEEVCNTIRSLKENSEESFELILINDCSNDGFNYKEVALKFGAKYIEHQSRMGVAASRDEAIALCETDYFLLLDAHMRIYQNNWVSLILNELKKNEKNLLCCQTIALFPDGTIDPERSSDKGMGAIFNFNDLSIKWIHFPNVDQKIESIDIPCVLGASYACKKEHWEYLKGLDGLRFYGCDEQLISIKVWLEGGRCKSLPHITFGHIFRKHESVPYQIVMADYVFNRILIAELFFDTEKKITFMQKMRETHGRKLVCEAIEMLSLMKNKLFEDKKYYAEIFTRDIDCLVRFNENIKILYPK